jgi:hypothetical protein
MLDRAAEAWRPPVFRRPGGALSRLFAVCRRFLDLQAGSIWRDLMITGASLPPASTNCYPARGLQSPASMLAAMP